jgi:hypothetical protein
MKQFTTTSNQNTHFQVSDFGAMMRMVDTINNRLDNVVDTPQWINTKRVCARIGLTYNGAKNSTGRKILMQIKKHGYLQSTCEHGRLFLTSEVETVMKDLQSGKINLNSIKKEIWK